MSLSSIYRTDEDPSTPNLKSVMAKLAVMNPQQLQAFAAAHENDPIMLSAAQSVKNGHEEYAKHKMAMQNGSPPPVNQQVVQNMAPQPQGMPPQGMPPQGPQGGPPQGMPPQGPQGMPPQGPQGGPPQGGPMPAGAAGGNVYDLPEDVGIGRLPTPNIARMAEGGITGFSDEEPVMRMADGGMVAFADGGNVPRMSAGGVPPRPVQRMPGDPAAANWDRLYGAEYAPDGTPKASKQQYILDPATKSYVLNPEYVAPKPAATATTPAPQGTSPLINKEQGVVDKAIERKRIEDEAAASGTKLPAEPGLPSLNAAMKQYEDTVYKNAPDKATIQRELNDIDKPVLDAMRAGINKEAARLKTDKEQDFYMALIQGGLAAAAGDSPYALQNIAKGFSTGAASYKDALKDFRKATQENTKAEMELARYEATGKKDALKSYNDHISKRDDRYAQGAAGIIQQNMASSASLSAAKINRDAMGDYRNAGQVETIRKNIDAKLGDDPKYKFDATKRAAEVERRLQIELQRYPNLVGYAGSPTGGGAPSALKYNEKTGKIE